MNDHDRAVKAVQREQSPRNYPLPPDWVMALLAFLLLLIGTRAYLARHREYREFAPRDRYSAGEGRGR